jgi:hypothetical protein
MAARRTDEGLLSPEETDQCVVCPVGGDALVSGQSRSTRRSAADLLETPGALLTRTHLRELGLERRAVDAVFRSLPVVVLPGYKRPLIRAADYRTLLDEHTYYSDDRVRPR